MHSLRTAWYLLLPLQFSGMLKICACAWLAYYFNPVYIISDTPHEAFREIFADHPSHEHETGLPLVEFLFKSTMLFQRFSCLNTDKQLFTTHVTYVQCPLFHSKILIYQFLPLSQG